MPDPKKIEVPPLKKKGRTLVAVGQDSLTAALKWDKLTRDLAPATAKADPEPVEAPDTPATES